MNFTLVDALPVRNELGEGVIWDSRRGLVWWSDIEGRQLLSYDPQARAVVAVDTPHRLGAFAPVLDSDWFVAAFDFGFAWYHPPSSRVQVIHEIEADDSRTRLNDGRTDRQGRFWAGSMVEGDDREPATGRLYCLDAALGLSVHREGIAISNGLCFSPDGSTAWHTDTVTGRIDRFALAPDGALTARRSFAVRDRDGWPDGATVDADGALYSARWGAGCVLRYAADGSKDQRIDVPASQASCVAFGGEDLSMMFVTSARITLDADALAAQPQAGDLFVFETSARGVADAPFAGTPPAGGD